MAMKKKLSVREYVYVASMLFGMFFGAGNLIFPVAVGQEAGRNIWQAAAGLMITGVGLPLLGIVPDDANVTLAAVEGKPLCQYTFQGASLACLHIAKRLQGKRVKLMKIRRTLAGM